MFSRNPSLLNAIAASLLVVIRSEISDLNPPPNICVCVDIHNCNVRDSACGNVIDQAPHDGCYIYTGQKTECSLSGNLVQFFETIYYGQSGWIFGSNLILGTGPECGISDECAQISCQNGGSCYNTLDGLICMCIPGYEGVTCQNDINECQSNPCLNGGTCVDQINGYVCTCVCTIMCFTGLQCQTGFTVLILRNDVAGSNSHAFNLPWAQYTQGFGNPATHYWIGLGSLYQATQINCQIRFDLQSLDGTWYNAQYSSFKVGDSSASYRLTIGGFSGNTYDAMAYHNGQQFSTYDRDNDQASFNCAERFFGGFWFNNCVFADITVSPADVNFRWYDPLNADVNYIQLNVALVNLIC